MQNIETVSEFIAPYEDDLHVVFIGDNPDNDIIYLFKSCLNKSRKSLPDQLPRIHYNHMSASDLFKNKYTNILSHNTCIQIFDTEFSYNVINTITDELDDDMEAMLIDKHILNTNQEKFIFDITLISDHTLATLCAHLDCINGNYNYLICQNYLALWKLYKDIIY